MPALTPNSPAGRFEHVIRTYWSKPLGKPEVGDVQQTLDGVVLDVFYVTISLVGAEARAQMPGVCISHEPGDLNVRFSAHELSVEKIQKRLDAAADEEHQWVAGHVKRARAAVAMLKRLGQPYAYDESGVISWSGEQWGLASLVWEAVALPAQSPADFLIPWVARELVKLAKAVVSHARADDWSAARKDYFDAVDVLSDKSPAVAQWAKETRTDIGKVDLATALEAIKTYKFKKSTVEQGVVVYTFSDGWTAQELRSELALSQEGKNMQNCVGGYCEDVERGDVRIYSLRDANGSPHVTMELRVPSGPSNYGSELLPEAFVRSEKRLRWHFAQILGKQNDMPTEAYRERAREFIDKVFAREGIGWCVAGGTAKWARFAGRHLERIDFPEILGTNHVEENVLAGADFRGANLKNSKFNGLDLSGSVFESALLSDADLNGCNLMSAKFDGAKCHFTLLRYANLREASFDSAHLGAADFSAADVSEASFRAARVDGAEFTGVKGAASANWTDVDLTVTQKAQLRLPVEASPLHLDWRSK